MKFKCIEKIRDNSGKILAYKIENENGVSRNWYPLEVKDALILGVPEITNLKLTSDGRIINKRDNKKTDKLNDIVAHTHKQIQDYIDNNNLKFNISNNRIEDNEYEIRIHRTMSDCDITIFNVNIEYDKENNTYKITYGKLSDLYKTYKFNDVRGKLMYTELVFSEDMVLDIRRLNARLRVELRAAVSLFKNLLGNIRYK